MTRIGPRDLSVGAVAGRSCHNAGAEAALSVFLLRLACLVKTAGGPGAWPRAVSGAAFAYGLGTRAARLLVNEQLRLEPLRPAGDPNGLHCERHHGDCEDHHRDLEGKAA